MPNWCYNSIAFTDITDEEFEKVKERVASLNTSDRNEVFDFDRIIHMPSTLNIECSSFSDTSVSYYLTVTNPETPVYKGYKKLSIDEYNNLIKAVMPNSPAPPLNIRPKYETNLSEDRLKEIDENLSPTYFGSSDKNPYTLGETVITNLILYGEKDWYGWSCKNWGTKWNACQTCVDESAHCFYFDTAWSPCIPIVEALSKKLFPLYEIVFKFADSDDVGGFAGIMTFLNGDLIDEVAPVNAAETLKLAAEILNYDLIDLGFYHDESKDIYIYIGNDFPVTQKLIKKQNKPLRKKTSRIL